jgi:hypothetical protein
MEFDSKEEKYFSWWLETLKQWNYIESWNKNEESFILTDDVKIRYTVPMKRVDDKIKEQILLKGRVYTPDFIIKWKPQAEGIFHQPLKDGKKITTPFVSQDAISIVEVKGVFDNNNMTRLATLNIKDVYQRYAIYISMTKVPDIFKKTFTPEMYLLTDKSFAPRKINFNARSIKEFINSLPT